MKKYQVTLYPVGSLDVAAECFVDADSADEAHNRAITVIRKQYPEADLELYDQFAVMEILWKTPSPD